MKKQKKRKELIIKKGLTLTVFFLISILHLYSQISTSNHYFINKSPDAKSTLKAFDYTLKSSSIETSDYGWTSQNSGTTNDLNCVHFINENEGWITVANQGLLNTIDGGKTWSFINMDGWDADFKHVYFLDSDLGFLSGNRTLLRTFDCGRTWNGIQFSSSYRYRNASFPVGSRLWMVGGAFPPECERSFFRYNFWADGSIHHFISSDYGQCSTILMDIYMTDDSTGWAVGNPGEIWKITNGLAGTPDITRQVSGTTLSLNSVFMLN